MASPTLLEDNPGILNNNGDQVRFKWVGGLQLVDPNEIPVRIKDVQDRLHKSIIRQWRTAITGDPDRYEIPQ
jgi:hypothetical protein